MKNYYIFTTTLLIISLGIAGTAAIAFVVVKPVAAYDNYDDDDNIFRIDHIPGTDKVTHFDSLDDCHDYIQHHSQSGLSFKDCVEDWRMYIHSIYFINDPQIVKLNHIE